MAETNPARRGRRGTLAFVAAFGLAYLLVVALFFFRIKAANHGMFLYALDDPFIHLALSQEIAHGHYGINPGEFSSPSSSILWPFLLAPAALSRMSLYMPLLLNIIFGGASVLLLAFAVWNWPSSASDSKKQRLLDKAVTVTLLILGANLISLTFIGMEHTLQIFLAITAAVGLTFAWDGGELPLWCLAAAALAPLVRYEDVSIAFSVAMVLFLTRQRTKAVLLLAISLAPLLLFGVFLHHLGLPMLPSSLLVKGEVSSHTSGLLGALQTVILQSFSKTLHQRERWPLLVGGVIAAISAFKARDRQHRILLSAAAVQAALQSAVGRFGWFYRYEVYAVIFVAVLLCRSMTWTMTGWRRYATLLILASPYFLALKKTVSATQDIYSQQYQMHRFLTHFYKRDVAVNDLGWISYQRPPGVQILDVFGLGSVEAAMRPDKTASWLEQFVSRRHVGLAIIYPEWFHIPASWVPVARMCELKPIEIQGGQCVMFFSTEPGATATIRRDLAAFGPSLPDGVSLQLDPPRDQIPQYQPKPL